MLLYYCLFGNERFKYGSWNVLRFLMIIVSLNLKCHQKEGFININRITFSNEADYWNPDTDFE